MPYLTSTIQGNLPTAITSNSTSLIFFTTFIARAFVPLFFHNITVISSISYSLPITSVFASTKIYFCPNYFCHSSKTISKTASIFVSFPPSPFLPQPATPFQLPVSSLHLHYPLLYSYSAHLSFALLHEILYFVLPHTKYLRLHLFFLLYSSTPTASSFFRRWVFRHFVVAGERPGSSSARPSVRSSFGVGKEKEGRETEL